MVRSRIYATLLCLISFWSSSQSDFRFRNYSINDGLSQSSVTCIVQDELNSLWIGTQDGLNRYDGSSFEIFVADNTKGLQSSYIRCSEKDDHTIWFGTNNGLTKFDLTNESFETYSPKKTAALRIKDIAVVDNNLIWIASEESGLYSFNNKTKQFKSYLAEVRTRKINLVHVLNNGTLLISTDNKGLVLFDPKTDGARKLNIEESIQLLDINNIIPKDNSHVIIATNSGAYTLNVESGKTERLFKEVYENYGNQNVSEIGRAHV